MKVRNTIRSLIPMPRHTHYVPCIRRDLVRVLFYEAKHRRQPMTRLVDELLSGALAGTTGWQIAHNVSLVQEQPDNPRRATTR